MAEALATPSELLNKAVASFHAGELNLACATCFTILQVHPAHLDALLILAAAWLQQGQACAARQTIDHALQAAPGHLEANKLLRAIGTTREHAAVLPTDSAQAFFETGLQHWGGQQHYAALACWFRALALEPERVDILNCRARAFAVLGFHDAALADLDYALALSPDFAAAHNNRGALLHRLGRLTAAAKSYRDAIKSRPGYALAHANLGNAQLELGHLDEAMIEYEAAITIDPEYADAHYNVGLISLLRGDFVRGWQEYEWRWKSSGRAEPPRSYPQPLWLGDVDLHGKRILLWSEQGFGDAIQFCRFAAQVAALGAVVILEAPASLESLLRPLKGIAQFVPAGNPVPPFDFHCPLLSLPLALQTTLDNLSGHPYLTAPPERIADWNKILGNATLPRVGLAWSGNAQVSNDHNRAIPLSQLIWGLPQGIDYIQLQKGVRHGDQATLAQLPGVRSFEAQVKDFGDTAALIEALDLVITIDTSIAHLAGALGKEVWVLLPFSPDWRWLLDRCDSPWYSSITLFRQPAPSDWGQVLASVRQALEERFEFQLGEHPSPPLHYQQ